MKASVLELRSNMRGLLEAIRRHEHVVITYRGRSVAVLVPYDEPQGERVADMAAFGMWRDREDLADVGSAVRRMRAGRRF